jgi:GTPase
MSGFVDEAQLHVKAGEGGAGAVSFRREAHVARGGPDGGDGGRGGDVWLEASTQHSSLVAFRDHPHRRATNGKHGGGNRRHGAGGSDLIVAVPVGTVVRAKDGEVLADLHIPAQRWLAARGGRGGRGNARFLTNRRRAPAFSELGERGEERWLDLELKLFADVALVGFPNSGKSTFVSTVSAARPKIADYPFTTLEPHLGVVRFGKLPDETEFVLADVPGLVEGASDGRGLGHRFLRHIERARVLLVLVDLAPGDGRSPSEQERVLLAELERYRPELVTRPRLVVGSRADLSDTAAPGDPELRISSVTGANIDELLGRLAELVSASRAQEQAGARQAIVVHRPVGEGVEVVRTDDGAFEIRGREALRAVELSDLDDPEAQSFAQRRLRTLGVERALARAGARDGDTVRLGQIEFTYYKDQVSSPVEDRRRARRGGARR